MYMCTINVHTVMCAICKFRNTGIRGFVHAYTYVEFLGFMVHIYPQKMMIFNCKNLRGYLSHAQPLHLLLNFDLLVVTAMLRGSPYASTTRDIIVFNDTKSELTVCQWGELD